ncbi:D-alanyl-D-alanine carboxypeptidase [Stappia albiluteola]|uniref:D-alanyl-D-alanine carboxypeptidase n=1 Tax=Stappia albiluteola TaxID=2758565 RepID=UPI001F2F8B09|nr:D-alanyl-D-alanine carboxypeptidase [Stappia albiluteola]
MSKGARRAVRFVKSIAWSAAIGFLASTIAIASDAEANPKYSGIVVDAKTGETLYSYKADTQRYPASLTKIMTLYILFEELEAGRLSLNSPLKVSSTAAAKAPSKLGLRPGSTIAAKDAILALVTKSANDIAATVAENISGSEAAFARRMTDTARRIGMRNTTFRNASGLPDSGQVTTARDMAQLGRAIQERFPKYYRYFGTRVFSYKGRKYANHNRLLGRVKGVDGIKTGYIGASGFNLVTSVKRDGREVVAVVMGGRTGASRNAQMTKLIETYLPKASRGRKTAPALVASAARTPANPLLALAKAPVPDQKPEIAAIEAALEEPVVTGAIPVPAPAKADTAPIKVASATGAGIPTAKSDINVNARIAGSPVFERRVVKTIKIVPGQPIPSPASQQVAAKAANDNAPVKPKAVAKAASGDETVTLASNNSADPQPGWQVQIAAAESEDLAVSMLKKAKTSVGRALRGKDPYTEPVAAGGATLYRARFVGFDTKSEAWNACKSLKQAKFKCYAIYE